MDVVFLMADPARRPVRSVRADAHFSRQGVEYARGYNEPAPELMEPLSGAAIAGGLSVALGIWGDLGALGWRRSHLGSCR